MKKIDRVKPVRRYRAAKYPSHADPDPTTTPAPVPFPFHRELVRAVAGVGLAASLGFAAQDPPAANPFSLAKSGLPHQTSPFGTGQPSYLSDDLARKVIDKVFKEGGFVLQRDVLYAKDGVIFRAAGYDPERRVGYVFGSWKTLGEDAIVNGAIQKGPAEPPTAAVMHGWLRERTVYKDLPEALHKRAVDALLLEDPEAVATAYREIRAAYQGERLSMEEMKTLEGRALKEKDFIAVVSQFDSRHHLRRDVTGPAIAKLTQDIDRERDPVKKEELRRRYREEEARTTLETLERNVREFLAWARANGLR